MVRDILDYQGNVIGQLELPDDTTEDVWAAKLAPYARAPVDPLQQYLNRTVSDGKKAAECVMDKFKKSNLLRFINSGASQELMIMQSLWVHHRLRAVELTVSGLPLVIDLLNLCVSGDIETAYFVIANMAPDDMSQPYHFLSAEVLGELAGLLRDQIGG